MDENNIKTAENIEKTEEKLEKTPRISCPTCKSLGVLVAGRCLTCQECGWSACSL